MSFYSQKTLKFSFILRPCKLNSGQMNVGVEFWGWGRGLQIAHQSWDGFTGTDSTAGSQERASERQSLVKGCELYILCQCLGQRSTHLINQKCAKERARARARETGRERFIFRSLYLSKHYDAGSGLVSFSA